LGRVGEALWSGPRAVGKVPGIAGNILEEWDFLCKMDRILQNHAKPMEVSEDSLHAFAFFYCD